MARAAAAGAPWRPAIYAQVLVIFLASRIVVIVGVLLGSLLVPTPAATWDAGPAWYHRLLRWDSPWYGEIAQQGYKFDPASTDYNSTVFYPLYPLIARGVKALLHVDEWIALLLVANVAALAVALLLTKLVRDDHGDEAALLAAALFFFFPSSLFLSAGYTESTCLVFTVSSLLLLRRGRFVPAALAAGFALGVRSTGIVLMPVIALEMILRHTGPWWRLLPKMALCMALAGSGLLAFMAYLGLEFGHPLAFATSQSAWHEGTFASRIASALTLRPFWTFDWRQGSAFVGAVALTALGFRWMRPALPLYGLGALMLPYLTLGLTDSMNRFVLMGFPAFICLAILCRGRQWLALPLIGVFAALLLANTALFSQWYWMG